MPDMKEIDKNRRSFFKWSLFGGAALAASVSGVGSVLLGREKEILVSILNDTGTVITDASRGSHHRLATTQNFLLANPVNPLDGQRIVWEIMQDSVGGRVMNLDDKFVFGSDLKKVELTTAPNKRDFLTAIYNRSMDQWHVVAFIRGY